MADIEQGTEAWRLLRLGIPTASRMADLMARTKSGFGANRGNLMADLIAERLTGKPNEGFINAAMQWGVDHEAEAIAAYEFYRDVTVERVPFVRHPLLESGASPDCLVGEDGLAEIKCPNTSTHIETLLNREIPSKYILQMQWQMVCAGRKWCDFVSFDPRMPERLRMIVIRVNRDDGKIAEMSFEVGKFLVEMNEKLENLKQLEV